MATLPQAVQQNGLTITKSSGSIFEVLSFTSEDGSMDNFDVANFMEARIDDQISRVSGVGNIQPIGQEYAMRIWLDPEKMRQYALMPSDIETALQAQNTDVSAGELGGQPALKGQQLDATVTARSRLHTPEQFAQVVLKADANGSVVHLGDVATIGLGAGKLRQHQHVQRQAVGLAGHRAQCRCQRHRRLQGRRGTAAAAAAVLAAGLPYSRGLQPPRRS